MQAGNDIITEYDPAQPWAWKLDVILHLLFTITKLSKKYNILHDFLHKSLPLNLYVPSC